jgi:high affinity Mn2+ porin
MPIRKLIFLLGVLEVLACGVASRAQQQPADAPAPSQSQTPAQTTPTDEAAANDAAPTIFPHSDGTRWFLAGQANIIFQAHGPFHSPYEGVHSLLSRGEYKTSLLGTFYTGFELNPNPRFATDGILDVESAGGRGISEAFGLAGFTNLDVVRNPSLGPAPYLSQYMIHQVIGFTDEMVDSERSTTSLETKLPVRRIEFYVGRMGLPDFFDINSVGTDSHLQFLNWTVDNNGAWDYAANTRGYTDGAVAEYVDHDFTARYGIAAMPVVANGIHLQYQFRQGSGQNVEFELRKGAGVFVKRLAERKGAVRLLGFVNHANMGDYRQQNLAYLKGLTPTPDITAHTFTDSMKYGVGLNFEQEVSQNGRVYGRFGWNEGQHESFAYTEVDQTFAVGADYALKGFGRPYDKLGLTFVTNAIKKDHQAYLALGGLGFLLGDGKLDYAREDIVEAYDNVHAWKGVYYALDLQFVDHPGYNQARGPVLVESVRMHVDF